MLDALPSCALDLLLVHLTDGWFRDEIQPEDRVPRGKFHLLNCHRADSVELQQLMLRYDTNDG